MEGIIAFAKVQQMAEQALARDRYAGTAALAP